MNKHAPGPWEIYERIKSKEWSLEEGYELCIHKKDSLIWLASVHTQFSDIEDPLANARLITAAPEMLEALKLCIDVLEDEGMHVPKVVYEAVSKATEE